MDSQYPITRWFRYDADTSTRLGLKNLVAKYGLVAEAMINRVDSYLRVSPNYKLPFDNVVLNGFATDWKMTPEKVKEFLQDAFTNRELSKNGDTFFSERILADMKWMADGIEHKRQAGIKGAQARWGKRDETPPTPFKKEKPVQSDVTDLAGKLKEFSSPAQAMDYLKRTIWPQAGLETMDDVVFSVLFTALKSEKATIVAETVLKFIKYGAGKTKPANYFKAILEDKRAS